MDETVVAHAVTASGVVEDARIVMEDGRITAIEPGAEGAQPLWAVPGFVDTHCHGAVGVSFGAADVEANRRAVAYHRAHGTTSIFASTVTRPMDVLVEEVRVLRGLVEEGEIDGIHLEGPFMAEEKKGAHDPALLLDPAPEHVERLIEAGGPALKMVTLAAELDHADAATRRFTEAGVVVAFGHSDADAETTHRAIDWGMTAATHLFNAMRPVHHRAPGPVPVLLDDERVLCEQICDGTHVHPDVVRMVVDAAGEGRVGLVTDAMSATGQGDGRYILGDLEVDVHDGTARLVTTDGEPGAIAGSTLTMDRAFEFMVQEVGCSIEQAAAMAATTPARFHNLTDVGVLEVGRLADICLVDDEGRLQRVIRRGEAVGS